VLDPVYDALGVPFDPDTVGSVSTAGGPDDPERVIDALGMELAGPHDDVTRERIRDT